MMMNILVLVGLFVSTAAYATMPQMTQDQLQASITPGINQICAQANTTHAVVQDSAATMALPQTTGLLPYVIASCSSPDAIAALIAKSDYNTYSWVYSLNAFMISDLREALGHH
jgi:hypothetical protein